VLSIVAVVLLDTTNEASLEWTRFPFGSNSATPGVSWNTRFIFEPVFYYPCTPIEKFFDPKQNKTQNNSHFSRRPFFIRSQSQLQSSGTATLSSFAENHLLIFFGIKGYLIILWLQKSSVFFLPNTYETDFQTSILQKFHSGKFLYLKICCISCLVYRNSILSQSTIYEILGQNCQLYRGIWSLAADI